MENFLLGTWLCGLAIAALLGLMGFVGMLVGVDFPWHYWQWYWILSSPFFVIFLLLVFGST